MESLQGKHFSITEAKNVNTIIYQINKTKKEYLDRFPKYTVERLDTSEELVGDMVRKTYYVDNIHKHGNELVLLSFNDDSVVINSGILIGNEVRISKKPGSFRFDTINPDETEYKEFNYTPNVERSISIIDLETKEEVIPEIFFDENAKEIRGKCKLKPYKSYFAFEIGEQK